jgi:ECF sigma factor
MPRRVATMARERPGHTFQTTALIHETCLRLVNIRKVKWQNRAHFFAICAQFMRRILIDFARAAPRNEAGQSFTRSSTKHCLCRLSRRQSFGS